AADRGWTRDALGNLVKTAGHGAPLRVLACGLDAPAYAVSEIRDDGYVRVQMAGNGPRQPLWDQFNEGQRVLVMTGNRATPGRVRMVPGVFGVKSVHLLRGTPPHEGLTQIGDLWLDVGAASAADVRRMGIHLLDPVFRDLVPWSVGDYATGPNAESRAGCAMVAAASTGVPATGTSIFVISAQSAFGYAGLLGVLARAPAVDSVFVFGDPAAPAPEGNAAVGESALRLPFPAAVHTGPVVAVTVRRADANTLIERISGADLTDLYAAAAAHAGVDAARLTLVRPDDALPAAAEARDSLTPYADLLARLGDRYGVSRHEGAVRDLVRANLPAWAKPLATVDTAGDLYVAAGPDRDTVVIVAHMDEVGFEVTGIEPDGRVALRNAGGFIPTLFEGQPALLHRDGDAQGSTARRDCMATSASAVRGVFLVPDQTAPPAGRGRGRAPAVHYAWFGPDPAALGIAPGMTVTGFKCAARLGRTRFTARSIDDRAGDTALLFAMQDLNPKTLTHKVIFAFSTREEIGLEGASALAAEFGVSVRRVYAIDTFVSSDTPFEPHRFADAPIGGGPVARMLDNSSVTPPEEFDALVRLARAHRIPLQWGTTNGGNDGSEFVRFGAVDVPIGWPLRYSHSPAETIDLRDVVSLSRLVHELAAGR
ncbi:MAG: M20/M25/M40 family metallo-hydrolase, partial [Gemmatimonadota bacterium]|nr:M20/M25/M40 family metallo-hydrolase [Gemmatimonadota bacterium]